MKSNIKKSKNDQNKSNSIKKINNKKKDEAKFITAVASNKRGLPIMNDVDYENLKNKLLIENSWVVKREKDPLEKLGFC
jgi:hypothetical protein